MDHIAVLREEFIETFSREILTPARLDYRSLVTKLLDLGLIPTAEPDNTYNNYLVRVLISAHLDYFSSDNLVNRMPKEIFSSKLYDLYGPEPVNYVYDKHWIKVLPGDLVVTGSLKVNKYVRRSNTNKANCLLHNIVSNRDQYVLRNSFVKISSEDINNILRITTAY